MKIDYMRMMGNLIDNGELELVYDTSKKLDASNIVSGTIVLSEMHYHGVCVEQDEIESERLLTKAVASGAEDEIFNFARLSSLGLGIEKDVVKGKQLMKRLENIGVERAITYSYGDECKCNSCRTEHGCGEGDVVKCGDSLEDTLTQIDECKEEEDLEMAFAIATQLHEWDIVEGTYELSRFYLYGKHVLQDLEKGVELLQIAASSGHEMAKYELACAHITGEGIEEDLSTGWFMMMNLSNNGYPDAIKVMGA